MAAFVPPGSVASLFLVRPRAPNVASLLLEAQKPVTLETPLKGCDEIKLQSTADKGFQEVFQLVNQ